MENTTKLCRIVVIVSMITVGIICLYSKNCFALEKSFDYLDQVEGKIESLRDKVDKKAKLIHSNYEQGVACYNEGVVYYNEGNFKEAVENFQKTLDALPSYEPAKVYIKIAAIQEKIRLKKDEINSIKLKMADTIADYELKVEQMQGELLITLLKQAMTYSEGGYFSEAEYYYNLCYKLSPENKRIISWFVDAIHKLKALSAHLDKYYKEIRNLSESISFD